MKRSIIITIIAALLVGVIAVTASAVEPTDGVVSFRIEGAQEYIYYDTEMTVTASDAMTLYDVIQSCPGVVNIVTSDGETSRRVTAVGSQTQTRTGKWLLRVNGQAVDTNLDATTVQNGDEIVLYYGNTTGMQYPVAELDRMMSQGIVRFVSPDERTGGVLPVADATVVWDGMTYKTNENGEIIIDSTGVGVDHTVQIDRCDASGIPTVLRFAPGYCVRLGFNDVTQGDWYYNAVMTVAGKLIMSGVTETTFEPAQNMNRAMFVTVLGRLSREHVDQTRASKFQDVRNDGWSAGYIAWATDNDIVAGNGDGTFGQYNDVTREQIAVMLCRYAQYRGFDVSGTDSLAAFPDEADVSDYALEALRWAVGYGLITGTDNGELLPGGVATRAQVATMLERFVSAYNL